MSSSGTKHIPLDLLRTILPHMSMKALTRFQVVSRDWYKMIAPYAKKFKQTGYDSQERITTLMTATIWLHDEMKPGETVGETLLRFGKEVPECRNDFHTNVEKLKELQQDVAMAKIWKNDVEGMTKEQVDTIIAEMRAILDSMMPTWSDEDKED